MLLVETNPGEVFVHRRPAGFAVWRHLILLCIGLIVGRDCMLRAAILPPERSVAWHAGIPGGIPAYPIGINVKEGAYRAAGDGVTDDSSVLQNAINACRNGQAVYLPAGVYRTTKQLNVLNKSIVIRGDGPGQTRILCDTTNVANVIKIYTGSAPVAAIDIVAGFKKGSTSLTLAGAGSIRAGDLVWISQLDDTNFVTIQTYTRSAPARIAVIMASAAWRSWTE